MREQYNGRAVGGVAAGAYLSSSANVLVVYRGNPGFGGKPTRYRFVRADEYEELPWVVPSDKYRGEWIVEK